VPVLQPDDGCGPAVHALIEATAAQVAIVVAYGQLFDAATLAALPLGFYNVHASLLPRWRGPSPIQAAIAAGDTQSGVTLFRLVKAMDAGPILLQRALTIGPDEHAASLHDRLATLGGEVVGEGLTCLARGEVHLVEQDHRLATRCRLLRPEDGRLDWSRTAQALHDQVRAMTPWPGARVLALPAAGTDLALTVLETRPLPDLLAAPGQRITCNEAALVVGSGRGALALLRVKMAGRRDMPADAFLRGTPLPADCRFARRDDAAWTHL
jgi:methionyl-tRNA formyltransferase